MTPVLLALLEDALKYDVLKIKIPAKIHIVDATTKHYRIRAQYVDTLYAQPGRRGPYINTLDGVLSMFFLKIRKDFSMRDIGIIFGLSAMQVSNVFKDILTHIQTTDPILQRNRSLATPQHLQALLEEVHQVNFLQDRIMK